MLALSECAGRSQIQRGRREQKDTYNYKRDIDTFNLNFIREPGLVSFDVQFIDLILKINRNWENIFSRDRAIGMLEASWSKIDADTQALIRLNFPKNVLLQTPLHTLFNGTI